MVATFGDVVCESSRAFADDEEEEFQNQSILRLATFKSCFEYQLKTLTWWLLMSPLRILVVMFVIFRFLVLKLNKQRLGKVFWRKGLAVLCFVRLLGELPWVIKSHMKIHHWFFFKLWNSGDNFVYIFVARIWGRFC